MQWIITTLSFKLGPTLMRSWLFHPDCWDKFGVHSCFVVMGNGLILFCLVLWILFAELGLLLSANCHWFQLSS